MKKSNNAKPFSKAYLILATMMIIFFVITTKLGLLTSEDTSVHLYGLNNAPETFIKKILNFLSYSLVNLDLGQLIVNVLLLGLVAKFEDKIGSLRFLLIYILGAVTAGACIFLKNEAYIITGSTGAFFALVGAISVYFYKNDLKHWLSTIALFVFLNILFKVSRGSLSPQLFQFEVNIFAHIIGFLTGILVATIAPIHKKRPLKFD